MGLHGYNPFGLLVFAGYILVALMAWLAALRFARVRPAGRAGDQARARVLTWALVGLLLLLLGIAKPLHLEAMITDHFRSAAENEGWYDDRRQQQAIYLIGALIAAGAIAVVLLTLSRKAGEAALIALCITLLLIGFTAARLVSQHDLDALLSMAIGRLTLSNAIELAGLVAIGATATSRPSSSWISQSAPSRRSRRRSR